MIWKCLRVLPRLSESGMDGKRTPADQNSDLEAGWVSKLPDPSSSGGRLATRVSSRRCGGTGSWQVNKWL